MEYTTEQYVRCLQEARKVMDKIDELQLATMRLYDIGFGWKNFGACLDELFEFRKAYGGVLSDCCIEAYNKEEATK